MAEEREGVSCAPARGEGRGGGRLKGGGSARGFEAAAQLLRAGRRRKRDSGGR